MSQGTSIAMKLTKAEFYNKYALEYLQRHPQVTLRYARRQARLRYRRYEQRPDPQSHTSSVHN